MLLERTIDGDVGLVSARLTHDVVLLGDFVGTFPDAMAFFVAVFAVVVSQDPLYSN